MKVEIWVTVAKPDNILLLSYSTSNADESMIYTLPKKAFQTACVFVSIAGFSMY